MPEAFDLDGTPEPEPKESHPSVPPPPRPASATPPAGGPTTQRPAPTQARPSVTVTGQLRESTTGVAPAPGSRASDLLRGHPNYKQSVERDNAPKTSFLTQDRRVTSLDDFATGVFWFAFVVTLACLAYYLFGVFSGELSGTAVKALASDKVAQNYTNIGLANTVMTASGLVATATLVFLFYDEGFAAYSLVGFAVFLQAILPLIIAQYYGLSKTAPSCLVDATLSGCAKYGTGSILTYTKNIAAIPGIPGFILLALEIVRQLVSKLETAKYAKNNLKYGQGMTLKHNKVRNQFLGPCWNMPYCRETVRTRCPIFLAKKGPCWRNKRGCMCDETIVLNATTGNWKETVASTVSTLEAKKSKTLAPVTQTVSAQQGMSMAFKKERCRQCVIYCTHQEQKYKALVATTFVAAGAFFFLGSGQLIGITEQAYDWFDTMLGRFSFNGSSGPTANSLGQVRLDAPVAWVLLTLVSIIALSKILQFIEYCCFKIKV